MADRTPLITPSPAKPPRVPRKRVPLTLKRVENAAPGTTIGDGLCPNLWLRTSVSGRRQWIVRYQFRKTRREMGLGSADLVSLSEARDACLAARKLIASGVDPVLQRRQQKAEAVKVVTFQAALDQYLEVHSPRWARPERTRQEWENSLSLYTAPLLKLQITDVDTPSILKPLSKIWADENKLAERIRYRVECILNFATAHGLRTGDNPARRKGHLEHLLPKLTGKADKVHQAALPYANISKLITDLHGKKGHPARCLEFVILTACRSGEARGAKWEEIDFQAGTWTVPATRMKARTPHVVPLSTQAIALLKQQQEVVKRSDALIFVPRSKKGLFDDSALRTVLNRLGYAVTVHGFRSTFRDYAGDKTEFPREVAEQCLAHTVGGAVEQAYRRSTAFEKRKALMQAWADWCSKPVRTPLLIAADQSASAAD